MAAKCKLQKFCSAPSRFCWLWLSKFATYTERNNYPHTLHTRRSLNDQDTNPRSDYLEIQKTPRLLIFKRFIHEGSRTLCCLPFGGDHSLSQGRPKSQFGTSFYPATPNREVLQNADSWTASETLKHQKGQIHTYMIFFFLLLRERTTVVVIVVFVSNWRKNPERAFHQNCPVV